MRANFLQNLRGKHSSIWLSDVERCFIASSQLEQWIRDGIVQGLLTSYSSLERSLLLTQEYDRDFQAAQQYFNHDAASLYNYIVIHDVQLAADRLKRIYDQTHGWNGYVNLNLPPDAETILAEAQQLWKTVGWSNFMLKIPATPGLLPGIQTLISKNINVNATLVISQLIYTQVAEAYLSGLEALASQGKKLNQVASVASIPIRCFGHAVRAIGVEQQELLPMVITQVERFKQQYQAIYQGDRWQRLADRGAKPQRLLWDITGIDNPIDVTFYIQCCLAPKTVIEISIDLWNALYVNEPLQFYLTKNLGTLNSKINRSISRDYLEIHFEDIANEWFTKEIKQLNQAYAQALGIIEQKQKEHFF